MAITLNSEEEVVNYRCNVGVDTFSPEVVGTCKLVLVGVEICEPGLVVAGTCIHKVSLVEVVTCRPGLVVVETCIHRVSLVVVVTCEPV